MGNEFVATLITAFVLIMIVVAVVVPTTTDVITANRATTAVANEKFTSAGGVAYSTAHSPIAAVSNMYVNTVNTTINTTAMNSSNSSELFVLLTPLDTDGTEYYNITVRYNKTAATNVSVYDNGVFLGNLSSNGVHQSDTWSRNTTGAVSPINISFYNGISLIAANLTNVSISYIWLNTTSNYTFGATSITPAPAGIYRASYTYFTANDVINNSMMSVIPLLMIVALMVALVGALFVFDMF